MRRQGRCDECGERLTGRRLVDWFVLHCFSWWRGEYERVLCRACRDKI